MISAIPDLRMARGGTGRKKKKKPFEKSNSTGWPSFTTGSLSLAPAQPGFNTGDGEFPEAFGSHRAAG